MESDTIVIYVLSAAFALSIWGFILYYIVKEAVKEGSEKTNKELRIQNRLLMMQLLKQGISSEDLLSIHRETPEKFLERIKTN